MSACLDSWAVLAWLDGEQPAQARLDALVRRRPVMSWINAVEVYYRIERDHGRGQAEEVLSDLRQLLELELPGITRMLDAARLKATLPIALADCFAIATAAAHRLTLLTGDPEILESEGLPCATEDLRRARRLHSRLAPAIRRATTPRRSPMGLTPEMPAHQLPETGVGRETAYELISSELLLDGQARLNLATFVTTWMPSTAARLMAETADKNMIDKDEYPQTAELEARCVDILADLWNAPERQPATGCSTTGSSEAAMLCGMALKWRWRERMRSAGKPADRPNLVMGANVQVCWDKFCRYWEVEPRLVPMEGERFHLGPEEAVARCDENTIGVVGIFGSTFDGSYEPIKEIAAALDELESSTGLYVPLHVDAASGGFVAPFIQPEIEWDFRIERVQSINASGHKYGLVYPGVGWAIWRDRDALPEDLIFNVNYLGGQMPTFALNFSRPGSEVIAQYFMFASLGREGYRSVIQTTQDVARHISSGIAEIGPYRLLTDGSELPVFAFALREEVENYSVFDVSDRLRQRGWLVPAYTFPENRQDLSVLRVVVRAGMTHEMADLLIEHVKEQTDFLESLTAPLPGEQRAGFAHN